MATILAIKSGPQRGQQFSLDRRRAMHVGRASNCEILLADPVSSRFHAVLFFEDGDWHLRDTSSRNGTMVNGQKVDQARLIDQTLITIGGTDMQLIEQDFESSEEDSVGALTLQSDSVVVGAWRSDANDIALDGVAGELLADLYQLSLMLLRGQIAEDGEEVLDTALGLLLDRSFADSIELTCDDGSGRLKPVRTVPSGKNQPVKLSRSTVRRVIDNGESLWLQGNAPEFDSKVTQHWNDAIIVPLGVDSIEGAIAVYRSSGEFNSQTFELVRAASRLVGLGWTTTQRQSQLQHDHRHRELKAGPDNEIVGESQSMERLRGKIARVGRANGSVLIRGESGVGKELVARAVHRASQRPKRPMLTVNCAAIPSELIESQLFGHKKGAFTGADQDHIGWFEQANTGTLFLDEIGELTLEGQAKLLRILEGHPFLPVGGTQEVMVDVRVIAATNRDLAEFVREKCFREDLFYRLSVFELLVPPLRDRDGDIDRLVEHFLAQLRVVHGRTNLTLSNAAKKLLLDYSWPGNVRQLRNVIDSAVVMADGDKIEPEDIGLRDAGVDSLDTLRIDTWEKRLIEKALQKTNGSVPEASKLLGISRATTYRKISEYDIER
ncbi:MAG: sigma 54-interacting transcriptional regulator [Planctomycetota bacterium]